MADAGVPPAPCRDRRVSRVILLDDADRVLLFDSALSYTRVWLTPGGGVEPGENFEEAALRELREEAGITGVELGPCLFSTEFAFLHEGQGWHQRERYYLVRVESQSIQKAGWTLSEAKEIQETRWWTVEDLRTSHQDFRPRDLPSIAEAIAENALDRIAPFQAIENSARLLPLPDSHD